MAGISRRLSRAFAVAAIAALLVAAAVTWRVASPPWTSIQAERAAQQIADARTQVDEEEVRLATVQTTLAYRRAAAASADAAAAREASAERLAANAARQGEIGERLDGLERRIRELRDAEGDDPERETFVRLSGSPGIREDDLEAWIEERADPAGPTAERRRLEEERAALGAELDQLVDEEEKLAGPARAASELISSYRVPLERARARLARLEGWSPGVREIATPAGGIERCTTCHPGMDDLAATHDSQPAGGPYEGWGCTVCHGGNGRALSAEEAHRFLTLRPWSEGDDFDLMPLIDRLESADKEERAATATALRRLTGREFGFRYHAPAEQRSEAVLAWRTWWLAARGFFRPPYPAGLQALGHDASGRPESYTGAGTCLRCHESRQRRHVERWRASKFTSFDRLEGVEDTASCLPCHTTGYDPASGGYVQRGVTCEGCHGPGAGYAAAMEGGVRLQATGAVEPGERVLDEVSTELRGRMAQGNVCVECHDPFGVKDLAYEHLM